MPLLIVAAAFLLVLLLTWLIGKADAWVIREPGLGAVEGTRPVLFTCGLCAGLAGAMLIFGYMIVTVPGIGDVASGTTEDQPAPVALLYIGGALVVIGVAAVASAFASTHRQPPADQVIASGCGSFFMALIAIGAADVAAIAVALAAPHSSLRWRPVWLAIIFTTLGVVLGAGTSMQSTRR